MKYLVFTDLDGTLLDHDTYAYDEALPAINMLAEHACPVIFNSSKTATEIKQLRQELNNVHPFIVENGSAVCIPTGYFSTNYSPPANMGNRLEVQALGPNYQDLLQKLHNIRDTKRFKFEGFFDLSADEVAELTGLDLWSAECAKHRAASEPLIWNDSEEALKVFRNMLHEHDLSLTKGGRFYHVMGNTNKAWAMQWLTELYRNTWPAINWTTVALGDGPNDQQMLEAADIAVVIPAASGKTLQLKRSERVICPAEQGPRGWQIAIDQIFQQSSDKGA